MHGGTNGGWTKGCILVNSSIDKTKARVFNLEESISTVYKIFDLMDQRRISNIKVIIRDEIN